MMTRLVKLLFFLALALLIAGLVAPNFIDWNKHKAEVMAQIQPYFQRKVSVAGNIAFKILPQPEILLESVSIANAEGAKEPNLITLKSLEARVKLEPLLEGRVEVENVNLTDPVLNLDVADYGKTSLSGVLTPSADIGAAASAIKLNQVTITNGTLHYSNQLTGLERTFGQLNLSVKADTLLGPYKISGDMLYQNTKVGIDMDTGVFDKGLSASTHISLLPAGGDLPQIRFSGDMNVTTGIDAEGELSLKQGKLGSLINVASLNALDFMNDTIDMTGTLQFKGNQLALNDIKAKFGKAGTLKGKLSVHYNGKGMPYLQANLEGSGLTITASPSDTYMNTPAEFQGGLNFKGKNIVWDGRHLETADIAATFNDKGWAIQSALVALLTNTRIKILSGTVTPKTNSADYMQLQITTDDLGKMVDTFSPSGANIFAALGSNIAPFKKLDMTTHLNISPATISFFDIDATLDDKEKVSGVLNVERVAMKPNVTAKLHFADWDSTAIPDGFTQALMKSDADLELTADNFTHGALKIKDLSFKGKTDGQGLAVQDLSGHLSDKDSFSATGHVATLAPAVTGLDISYTLKALHAADVAKNLGLDLPQMAGENFDLKGNVKGDAGKYIFTAQGGSDSLAWQGLLVSHPSFSVEAAPDMLKMSGLSGTVWDGELQSDITFTRPTQPAPAWSSTFKGSLKQADLQKLQDALGLKGFTTGKGDAEFDLSSADNTLAGTTGTVALQSSSVTVESFNAGKLADTLHQLTSMPDNLQQVIDDSFRKNGSTLFKDVQGKFKIDHGKVNIETLSLANATEKMTLSGSVDIPAGSYTISGDLSLIKPAGFPTLKVSRASGDKDYKIDGKQLESYIIKNLPPPAPPATPPVNAGPASKSASKKDQSINGILKRLDEGDAPAPSPKKPPAPAPAQQPDVKKAIEQMQMQQMMQQNSTLPLPLAPSP